MHGKGSREGEAQGEREGRRDGGTEGGESGRKDEIILSGGVLARYETIVDLSLRGEFGYTSSRPCRPPTLSQYERREKEDVDSVITSLTHTTTGIVSSKFFRVF